MATTRSQQHEADRYAATGVHWVVEVNCLILLPLGSTPVRLWGADAALWALLARGHDLGAIVTLMAAVTGEPQETAARYVQRSLTLWEEKGYVRREAADG